MDRPLWRSRTLPWRADPRQPCGDRPRRGASGGDGEEANNGEEQEMGPRRRGAWDEWLGLWPRALSFGSSDHRVRNYPIYPCG
ncbi:hypothetical protein QYE76_000996 [Lolium multiflorum]|uniref:Uncharacterized protein n=1 Tax=Lolium multiflorum TaxID=4521 RepID=A0AAD8RMW2_LOLMU|nr:hypothetical protein QYE76_000996 [Lolium multiflorum]